MTKYMVNLFDEHGNDCEVIVEGTKSLVNLMEYVFEQTGNELMARLYSEKEAEGNE